ncbi:MAG: hypothetical protein ABUL72_04215, partial [Armatimonadota bacterium]
NEVVLTQGVGIWVPGNPRSAVRKDIVEANILKLRGGDAYPLSKLDWQPVSADAKGEFSGPVFDGGYAWLRYDSPDDRVVFLEASGSSVSYANWAPRAGDPYSFNYVSLPVKLRRGRNDFMFAVGRGRLAAKLVDAPAGVTIDLRDTTSPYIGEGKNYSMSAVGIVLRNSAEVPMKATVTDQVAGASQVVASLTLPPLSTRKVPAYLPSVAGKHQLSVNGGAPETLELQPIKAGSAYKVTFKSNVDDSVQYYGVEESTKSDPDQSLFLSLHGASVEALGQAQAYGPHDFGNLIAATNRRPFGFDWEEVGRLDALEVLEQGKARFKPDPLRVYLTGHSMGGHGSWSIGSLFPDKFAAVMPSAGWISFTTYAGGATYREQDPVQAILKRANNA